MRNFEEIKAHYEMEKSLANQLRHASKAERSKLYPKLYNELICHFPHLRVNPDSTRAIDYAKRQLNFILNYLTPNTTLLEIGPGNCAFAMEASRYVRALIAVDVSTEITALANLPSNCKLVISDGSSIPVLPPLLRYHFKVEILI